MTRELNRHLTSKVVYFITVPEYLCPSFPVKELFIPIYGHVTCNASEWRIPPWPTDLEHSFVLCFGLWSMYGHDLHDLNPSRTFERISFCRLSSFSPLKQEGHIPNRSCSFSLITRIKTQLYSSIIATNFVSTQEMFF